MAYGFEVRNTTGKIIVDQQFPNLMATSKGTLSLALHTGSSTAKVTCNATSTRSSVVNFPEFRATVPRTDPGAFLFFEVTPGTRAYVGYAGSGTLRVYANQESIRWVRATFAKYLPIPTGEFGISVFDADGKCTYSSAYNFTVITGTLDNPPASGIWVAPATHGLIGGPNESFSGLWFDQGCRNDNGTLIPEGLRGNTLLDFPASAARPTRVRGLVADIDWAAI